MDILNDIIAAQGGGAVRQIGSQLGLGEEQTTSALSALVPELAAGLQQNVQGQGGLAGLITALSGGSHEQYLDNPTALGEPAAVDQGNTILGQLLGSKEASREVAGRAAARTGLSADVLKRMLPLAATLLMGALARRTGGQQAGAATGGLGGMLGSLLDGNRNGSMADDVAGALGRLLRRS
jgi:hypothetical protein